MCGWRLPSRHTGAEILVVDEVLAVGDGQFQKKCLGKMGEVAQGPHGPLRQPQYGRRAAARRYSSPASGRGVRRPGSRGDAAVSGDWGG